MIDLYDLKITAKYDGAQYTKIEEFDFTVEIIDACATADLTIDPSILTSASIAYTIGHQADI